ncbi:modifier of mdg4-like isoform X8 [Drosophila sulfurigaster albostrigata]|uniref:modifier of mdg4-like isoform X8 n=1 Tax=Drosophila sulfurigaster albostrigata TaxID=89887 RepID=UPI002D21D3F2|nr:modifier of mdg4-like isoform X8 [Drosophila sulfurigaster albostrigata]XP_062122755.1 modifier of mdg4-like isoform X8 [Drosophila sulfurigaster albostrigata]
MADDEQFSLCWNNFNTNLSAGFHESLCRGDLVDVSLAAEGQIVKAHRLVLSVCSPFFRKMFTQMPPNAHAFVFLNNVSHSALKDLIQFMYCGEVNVKQDALPAFISTAESLQIKGLTDNDPAPQPPQEPTPPPPAAPHVQQQQQQVPTQRVQRQQPRASARYKIETVDDVLGDDKGTTQIVIQTTTAPQATIVQQQQQQQQQQQTQHIQTQQQLQTGTTTTATLVSTNKRTAQRGSLVGSGNVKRSKTTTTTANVIDPLDTTPDTATTTTTAQQLASQQITVQTTVVPSETKVHQVRQQQAAAQEEAEYIDLPMELPTKSEPDYSEDHAEVAGDGDTTYVEDDTYGDMRYDDSYFTENEDAGAQTAGGNTSAANVSATTSKAVVKQQSQSYSDSSFVDTGADQGNTEAQGKPQQSTACKVNNKKETEVEITAINAKKDDAIPLYAGSNVFVSKTDLAAAYIPFPAIYTSRVADLVIGKTELNRIAFGNSSADQNIFEAIITHVCQVFAIHGSSLDKETVQKFIDYKLANIKALGSEIKR